MQPVLKVLDNKQDIDKLYLYLKDKNIIAVDTETTGLESGSTIMGVSICAEPSIAYYIMRYRWDKETHKLIETDSQGLDKIIGLLKTKQLLAHNAIFDCARIEETFKVSLIGSMHTDTMIMAHLINENRRIGLKELAKEYLGADSTKEQEEMKASVLANNGAWSVASKEMYKANPQLLGKYGAQDAWLTFRLFEIMLPILIDQGLDKFFYDEESMPLLRGPTYQLNTVGVKVDQVAMTSLKKQLEAECAEDMDFITSEIADKVKEKYPGTKKTNTFNIESNQHLAWLLFGKLNLEFDYLTKGGKETCKRMGMKLPYTKKAKAEFMSTVTSFNGTKLEREFGMKSVKIREPWAYIAVDKRSLETYAAKYKWIQKLLDYKKKQKILNTYIEGIEQRIRYGIIKPSFLQSGTTSGRYSSRNPNFQNLPRDDKRIKSCIVSRPGRVFVGADYSQLEPRVFAYFSKDPRLLKAFDGTSDFYSVIGMEVYGKTDCVPQKDGSPEAFGIKYKKLRDLSKVIALASTYGATPWQLAPTTGKGVEETGKDIENYFSAFPGVKDFQLQTHATAKKSGQVTNLFGRPRRMVEATKITKLYGNRSHADLPYTARNILNLAVNHTIQSTGASIVNRAAIMFNDLCIKEGIDSPIILQVHDSLVTECPEKDSSKVAELLRHAMENAVTLEGISLEAVPKIGCNLAEV